MQKTYFNKHAQDSSERTHKDVFQQLNINCSNLLHFTMSKDNLYSPTVHLKRCMQNQSYFGKITAKVKLGAITLWVKKM